MWNLMFCFIVCRAGMWNLMFCFIVRRAGMWNLMFCFIVCRAGMWNLMFCLVVIELVCRTCIVLFCCYRAGMGNLMFSFIVCRAGMWNLMFCLVVIELVCGTSQWCVQYSESRGCSACFRSTKISLSSNTYSLSATHCRFVTATGYYSCLYYQSPTLNWSCIMCV